MDTRRISSTELKTNTADILNMVAFGNMEAIVERHGEELVKIVPINKSRPKKDYKVLMNKHFGSAPNFPEVHKYRKSSTRKLDW